MVIDDIDKVKELQKDHGEWSECMSNVSNLLPHSCHIGAAHKSHWSHTHATFVPHTSFLFVCIFHQMCTKVNYTYLEIGRLNVRSSI